MTSPFETRVMANGLSHHVITWDGGGEEVVLCHGFLDLAWSWDAVARRLAAAGYRAIAFDFRGHGETDWVGPGGYYHFADYLLDLEELLDQLTSGPTHLVGHSMGGGVCSMYAGARPERVRTLTLAEGLGPPAHHPIEEAPDRTREWLDGVRRVRSRTPRALASIDEALARMRIQTPGLPDELGRFLAEKSTRPAPNGDGLVFSFDPLHRTPSPTGFRLDAYLAFTRRITAPTLLVVAEHGFRVPDEEARAATVRDRRVVEILDVGHMMHWLAPDSLADAIIEQLSLGGGPR